MHGVTNGRLKLQLFGHEEPGLIKHWAANPPAASYLQTKATFLVGHNFRSRIQHEFWSNDSDLSRRSPHLGWRNIMIWPDEFTPFFSFAWGFFRCHFGSTGCGRCWRWCSNFLVHWLAFETSFRDALATETRTLQSISMSGNVFVGLFERFLINQQKDPGITVQVSSSNTCIKLLGLSMDVIVSSLVSWYL